MMAGVAADTAAIVVLAGIAGASFIAGDRPRPPFEVPQWLYLLIGVVAAMFAIGIAVGSWHV